MKTESHSKGCRPARWWPQRSKAEPSRADWRSWDDELASLKSRLLRDLIRDTDGPLTRAVLRRAAGEAESLAWTTAFPLLMLPVLLEEKICEAREYLVRQMIVRETSRPLLILAE